MHMQHTQRGTQAQGWARAPDELHSLEAKVKITIVANASCAVVKAEMLARVVGISNSTWRDPRGGNYSLLSDDGSLEPVTFQRLSDDGDHRDKQKFSFVERGGDCEVAACGARQTPRIRSIAEHERQG